MTTMTESLAHYLSGLRGIKSAEASGTDIRITSSLFGLSNVHILDAAENWMRRFSNDEYLTLLGEKQGVFHRYIDLRIEGLSVTSDWHA